MTDGPCLRPRRGAALVLLGVSASGCARLREGALDPHSRIAESQLDLFNISLIIALVVFVVVMGLWAWALFRPRTVDGDGTQDRFPGTRFVALGGLVMPSVVLLSLMVVTFGFLASQPQDGELTIRVTGHRYWWEIHYPEHDAITANELHLPVGRDVEVILESNDVIHSLWVPELGGKIDLVPGRTNRMILRADEPGVFRGRCAEFCGLQHARMDFLVFAQQPGDFDRWAQQMAEPAVVRDREALRIFDEHACAACHTIRGTDADGQLGPDLTHLASRTTIGAAQLQNTPESLRTWIVANQSIKPGNRMPEITSLEAAELTTLIEYLGALE